MTERELFIAALREPDAAARVAFLEGACADEAMRSQVNSMLRDHEQLGSFLECPASPLAATAAADRALESPGAIIGPYKLMEQIGEGGMGIVFVADQTHPLRRRVALKVIKPGMDTRQVIARFEAERQALAMMDHSNIARVFDGGVTDSGRPYFVMELVRGIPITEYCDREKLSIAECLELFALVCRAVQHAHQKGIIHRDLKPSNILVTLHDGVPVPKVIDFGVAKATGQALTEKTIYTAFTQLVGTPLYMSPEQVEMSGLNVDTRSDIYSLGVLLYELLTGTTPFDSETLRQAAFDELRRIIREDEPPKPSTRLSNLGATLTPTSARRSSDPRHLNRTVRGELDWIAMKALEKDRARRYETANDFAADVMRYLTDQPVAACPPSVRYRLAKFLLRNRAVVIPVSVLTLLTVVGLSIGTAVIAHGRNVALRELARVRAERRELAAAYFEAYARVETFMWSFRDGNLDLEAWEKQMQVNVERAIALEEQLAPQLLSDPAGRFEAARCYEQLGWDLHSLGRFAEAEVSERRAVAVLTELCRESPSRADYRERQHGALTRLGKILVATGKPREAEDTFKLALSVNEVPAGGSLPRDFPGHGRVQEVMAAARINLVQLHMRLGAYDQAAQVMEEINDPLMLNNLAWILATADAPRLRDPARAVALARSATERAPNRASIWNTLGVATYRKGDWKAAIEALEKAEALEPDKSLAFNGFFLAMAHGQLGDLEQARTWYGRAARWMDKYQPQNAELRRFRAEAEELLGVDAAREP